MHRKGNNSIADDLMTELAEAFDELGRDRDPSGAIVLASRVREVLQRGGRPDRDGEPSIDRPGRARAGGRVHDADERALPGDRELPQAGDRGDQRPRSGWWQRARAVLRLPRHGRGRALPDRPDRVRTRHHPGRRRHAAVAAADREGQGDALSAGVAAASVPPRRWRSAWVDVAARRTHSRRPARSGGAAGAGRDAGDRDDQGRGRPAARTCHWTRHWRSRRTTSRAPR